MKEEKILHIHEFLPRLIILINLADTDDEARESKGYKKIKRFSPIANIFLRRVFHRCGMA